VTSDPHNAWRLATPGHAGWPRTARPGDPRKYFMVSADCHANEPSELWRERIDARYRDRIPGVRRDEDGKTYQVTEGFRPIRLRAIEFGGEDRERNQTGRTPEERLRDHARDGIDAEIIFPNKGLTMWATTGCRRWRRSRRATWMARSRR
jgi:hypothetical protein